IASNLNLIMPMFLILTIIALVSSSQFFFFLFHGEYSFVNYLKITFSKLIYFYYFILLAALLSIINSKFHLGKKRLIVWISFHSLLLVASFIIHQTITFFVDKLLLSENSSLSYSETLLRNPDAWIDIVAYILLLAGIILIDSKRISQENEIRCAQLEAMVIKSKLQELRTRIHPQFLFKTLGTIKARIRKKESREANNILSMLSDFLRTTVYESSKDEIELVEELRFLDTYLSIEKAALDGIIVYKENIASDSRNALVPIFIIQPIVETLLYELASETNSAFEFHIESSVQNSNLRIMLVTKFANGFYLSAYTVENLEAVKVVKERLEQIFASKQSFEVNCSNENIIEIRISFPFKENYENSAETLLMEN
ncbi:MAG: histidine kinase, partial [Ignavibacteria bacterium]|nr:histidine kinase [Ignavibacteria bacterium]